jgi:DNA-binding transcriptional MerR regulator
MKISEASRASGASPRSLRLYEDEGLIVPGRCSNGYRDYCPTTIDRVRVIRGLLEAGLSVRLVKKVLPVVADGRDLDQATRTELEDYHDRLVLRIGQLDRRRFSLAVFLGQLDAIEGLTFTHASGSYGSTHDTHRTCS